MISWTKLLTAESQSGDNLRYSYIRRCIPSVIVWNTTSRCNLRCRHCYYEASKTEKGHELTQKEAMGFIKDLSNFNVSALLFSGGEPLLRKDFLELGRFAFDRGIRPALSTNGTLITKKMAKRIKDSRFYYVGISLDGMERINDAFRRTKGAFRTALAAIRNCKESGLKVGLRFTLTKYNFKDMPAIFDLVKKESIPRFCIYHLVYTGRGRRLGEKDLDNKEKRQVLELIWNRSIDFCNKGLNIEVLTVDNHADGAWFYLRLRREDPLTAKRVLKLLKAQEGNSSGIRIGAVDSLGNIYPDQFWRTHILGNICERRFSDVWQDGKNNLLNALRNRKVLLKGRCQRCNFVALCNGNFRARAEAATGDLWGEDPSCYLTEEEICS